MHILHSVLYIYIWTRDAHMYNVPNNFRYLNCADYCCGTRLFLIIVRRTNAINFLICEERIGVCARFSNKYIYIYMSTRASRSLVRQNIRTHMVLHATDRGDCAKTVCAAVVGEKFIIIFAPWGEGRGFVVSDEK